MASKSDIIVNTFKHGAIVITLNMPSGNPGLDMSLGIKVVSAMHDTTFARQFTMKDLSGLCPVLGAFPKMLPSIIKRPFNFEINDQFNIVHITYKFSVCLIEPDDRSSFSLSPKGMQFECELQLNVGSLNEEKKSSDREKELERELNDVKLELKKIRSETNESEDNAKRQKINTDSEISLQENDQCE
jgi:hypothetical protein